MVKTIATALIDKGKFQRAYLGVTIGDVTEELVDFYGTREGAVILSVQEGMPAEKGGLKRGDLIIKVGSKTVRDASALRNAIGSYPPGTTVPVTYIRDKKRYEKEIRLGDLDEAGSFATSGGTAYEGMTLENLGNELRRRMGIDRGIEGVAVTSVEPGSKADESGVRPGDVIIQVENVEITDLEDFRSVTKSRGKKRFYIFRQGGVFLTVF